MILADLLASPLIGIAKMLLALIAAAAVLVGGGA